MEKTDTHPPTQEKMICTHISSTYIETPSAWLPQIKNARHLFLLQVVKNLLHNDWETKSLEHNSTTRALWGVLPSWCSRFPSMNFF